MRRSINLLAGLIRIGTLIASRIDGGDGEIVGVPGRKNRRDVACFRHIGARA